MQNHRSNFIKGSIHHHCSMVSLYIVFFLVTLFSSVTETLGSQESLLPFFPSVVDNVTVSHGRKAVLKCEVQNLRNYKVAWVRVDTHTILTIHNNLITRNPRISLSRPGENLWYLHINNVQETDRGWYMCQINTDPMVHKSGYLEVVGDERQGLPGGMPVGLPGGIFDIEVNDDHSAVAAAVATLGGVTRASNPVSTCGKKIELVGVENAQGQIVQGKIYYFTLRIATHDEDDCTTQVEKVCEGITVWGKLRHDCPEYEPCYELLGQENIRCKGAAQTLEKEYYNIEGFRCIDECKFDARAQIFTCNPVNGTRFCSPDSMTTYRNEICQEKCSHDAGKYFKCNIVRESGSISRMPCSPQPDP